MDLAPDALAEQAQDQQQPAAGPDASAALQQLDQELSELLDAPAPTDQVSPAVQQKQQEQKQGQPLSSSHVNDRFLQHDQLQAKASDLSRRMKVERRARTRLEATRANVQQDVADTQQQLKQVQEHLS